MKKIAVYFLLSLQLIWSFGYPNEFEDHILIFIFSGIFFLSQIFFLFKINPKKGVTILISLITTIHFFTLLSIIQDDGASISNAYPAELYYSTWGWVTVMSVCSLVLDMVKLIVVHDNRLK